MNGSTARGRIWCGRIPLSVRHLLAAGMAVAAMVFPASPAAAIGPVSPSSLLDAGAAHSVQIRPDGTLWAWGNTSAGPLGEAEWPVRMPTQVGTDADWEQVSAGSSFTLAIKSDGTLWAWGVWFYGRLGLGDTLLSPVLPTQVGTDTDWKAVSAGRTHSLAVKQDGSLWAWGSNEFGAVGDGTVEPRWVPTRIGSANDWETVSGGYYSSAALKVDGSLWRWGDGVSAPVQVGTDGAWRTVSMGGFGRNMGIKSDGSLWELGSAPSSTPVRIGTGSDWSTVSAGSRFSTGTTTDGTLWTWGMDDGYGQLGYGLLPEDWTNTTAPQRVDDATDWAAAIAAMPGSHAFGVKSDGTTWGWGGGSSGQIGDGATVNRSRAVRVGGPVNSPPVALDDTVVMARDTKLELGLNLVGNDVDADADDLAASSFSYAAHGDVGWSFATGKPTYTPDPGFVGTDYFTYSAWDGNEYSDSQMRATVTVVVVPALDKVEVNLSNGIKLIFTHINTPGDSSASGLAPRHLGEASATVVPGHYYDIHTDVDFTGPVTVIVPYDPSKVTGDPTRLKLRHWNGTTAEDITTSVDTVNHTVTGQTTSFSDYWIEEPPGSGTWVLVSAAADLPSAGYALALLGVVAGLVWLRRRAA